MNANQTLKMSFSKSYNLLKKRKDIFYLIVFALALIAFEAFNYSTAEYALTDLLGDLSFGGIPWATLLAIAFCGIDFSGIAFLLAPLSQTQDNRSAWFMFGAWILAATMNAVLTWWGIVLAIQSHPAVSIRIIENGVINQSLPVLIALMVWVIRILLIGGLSKKSKPIKVVEKPNNIPKMSQRELRQAQSRAAHPELNNRSVAMGMSAAGKYQKENTKRGYKPEPTYIPMQDEAMFYSKR